MRWKGAAAIAEKLHESFGVTVRYVETDVFESWNSAYDLRNLIEIPCTTTYSYRLKEFKNM